MRAAPAFQVTLCRFGLWHAGVGSLALLGISALAAWCLDRPEPMDPTGLAAAAIAVLAVSGWAALLARAVPLNLAWDGQSWRMARADASPETSMAGDLAVAMDLGSWMLLRFDARDTAGARRHVHWIPAQRRGIETQWHALRCAVHAPRPSADADTAAGR